MDKKTTKINEATNGAQYGQVKETKETPDTVHGRLLESVHISGYTFDRAWGELTWLLDDGRWRQVGKGFDDVNAFLATISLSEFRIPIEQRQQLAKRLVAEQASQRATARVLGVGHRTIQRDLGGSSEPSSNGQPPQTGPESGVRGSHEPPPENHAEEWFQAAIDPAKEAKTRTARTKREEQREEKRQQNAAVVAGASDPRDLVGRFSTILVDPPWAFEDEGDVNQFGRGKHDYASMPLTDILRLPVDRLADTNCHLYLCITNRSMPKGFGLIEAWGFRYVTCVTWVKPTFGIGNYFRGQTEHVLFAVKGSQPLKRHDVGTVFHADRGAQHSSKPEELLTLIESCSPAPYLELFQRTPRPGWTGWGEVLTGRTAADAIPV